MLKIDLGVDPPANNKRARMSGIKEISNEDLQLADISEDVSDWGEFIKFALSMNGYEAVGSLK
jgi:hypothetical protein